MKLWLGIIFLLSAAVVAMSQPSICDPPAAMTSLCSQACIICDINGFQGRNNSNVTGQAPPGFCTSVVHHMQWIGFIAGSVDLTLEVYVTNCTRNNGLEIGLYESLNCQSFRQVSECDTDVRPGQRRIFNNTVPLTIGQYYYLVMDGSGDDICDYSIRVLSGSTQVAPLNQAPQIDIPKILCAGEWGEFSSQRLTGATFYDWYINGEFAENNLEIRKKFLQPGKYEICLHVYNVCSKAPVICKSLDVLPIPEKKISADLCFGQCYRFYDQDYCESGNYTSRVPNSEGCDSLVTLELNIANIIRTTGEYNICEGDSLLLGNSVFTQAGNYETEVTTAEGCKILLSFTLDLIQCNISAVSSVKPQDCSYKKNGSITVVVTQGTLPLHYTGFKTENPSVLINGTITNPDKSFTVNNLDGGNYHFRIEDNFGNTSFINVFLPQPLPITATIETSDYNGYEIKCFGEKSGWIKVMPSGGTPLYTISSPDFNVTDASIQNLGPGSYKLVITDFNQCVTDTIITLHQPDSLAIEYSLKQPDCSGIRSGSITITKGNGGVPPYIFRFNDAMILLPNLKSDLAPGIYSIIIEDANQCYKKLDLTLNEKVIPQFTIEPDTISIDLGESALLEIISGYGVDSLKWSPITGLDCDDCHKVNASPLQNTRYNVRAVSEDGCITTKLVDVKVRKKRSFVISNIFSPDGNQLNDKLMYYAGKDVSSIPEMHIYDRWGNEVFHANDLNIGLQELNWEAVFNSGKLTTGQYTYWIRVNYLDGESVIYKGSLYLL